MINFVVFAFLSQETNFTHRTVLGRLKQTKILCWRVLRIPLHCTDSWSQIRTPLVSRSPSHRSTTTCCPLSSHSTSAVNFNSPQPAAQAPLWHICDVYLVVSSFIKFPCNRIHFLMLTLLVQTPRFAAIHCSPGLQYGNCTFFWFTCLTGKKSKKTNVFTFYELNWSYESVSPLVFKWSTSHHEVILSQICEPLLSANVCERPVWNHWK